MTSPVPFFEFVIFWIAFAACVGSFMTMAVYRIPVILDSLEAGKEPPFSLWAPASHCPSCKNALKWHQNIPLLGWILSRGRCGHCGVKIPARYLALEVIAVAWAGICAYLLPEQPVAVAAWSIFGWFLIAGAWMDAKTTWLPDVVTIGLLWAGLLFTGLPGSTLSSMEAIVAVVVVWVGLSLFQQAYLALRGVVGLAGGDVKLLAALAAWLPWKSLPLILAAACAVFIAQYIATALRTKGEMSRAQPLGPALAVAALGYWLWAQLA